jgi:hypothetical protein
MPTVPNGKSAFAPSERKESQGLVILSINKNYLISTEEII